MKWTGLGQDRGARVGGVKETTHGSAPLHVGDYVVKVSPDYYRPVDPERLLGNSSKATEEIGWRPTTKFEEIVKLMVAADIKSAKLLLEGTLKHNEQWRENLV